MTRLAALAFAAALMISTPSALHAQNAIPAGQGDPFKDTSMLKLPPGQRAAIFEWEDLECPACARAFPITHAAVEHYHIPLYRHDFVISGHIWSRQAETIARYLEDKVSPQIAEEYRRDVFANQAAIASQDDLMAFTQRWFANHKLQLPFVIDPSGRFAAEIQADITLANRLGLRETPTIIVLSPHGWTQVKDINQLYFAIDQALAQTPAPKPAPHKPTH
jgi:protein-disulfide isomerase